MRHRIYNYTALLGKDLILAGFTLCTDGLNEVLARHGARLKTYHTDTHTLEAIKRYCKLYLQGLNPS